MSMAKRKQKVHSYSAVELATQREGQLFQPSKKRFRGLDDGKCEIPRSALGTVPCILATAKSMPLECSDGKALQSHCEEPEADGEMKEAVVQGCRPMDPYRDCVGVDAPLNMQGHKLNLQDDASIIQVANQDFKIIQKPGHMKHRREHQGLTGAGLEFPMSQDDTVHTGIMFASGCLLMRRAYWRKKKVRLRTFNAFGHTGCSDSKFRFPDIPKGTDHTECGVLDRASILRQVDLCLRELCMQGLQK
jgi:hypothetical protein